MSEKTKDSGLKASVQKLGSYLSSMVMPNIGQLLSGGYYNSWRCRLNC